MFPCASNANEKPQRFSVPMRDVTSSYTSVASPKSTWRDINRRFEESKPTASGNYVGGSGMFLRLPSVPNTQVVPQEHVEALLPVATATSPTMNAALAAAVKRNDAATSTASTRTVERFRPSSTLI